MTKKIIAIISPESAPIRKLIQDAKNNQRLVNATYGRRTRSVLVMTDNVIVLSSVQPETIANRTNLIVTEMKDKDVDE